MTEEELKCYGCRNGVIISREASRQFADYRDELGQTVQLDGLIEDIAGTTARVRVLVHIGNRSRSEPMLGVTSWINASDLEPYEGINVWTESLVRANLRKRKGEQDDQPRQSPFWAEL